MDQAIIDHKTGPKAPPVEEPGIAFKLIARFAGYFLVLVIGTGIMAHEVFPYRYFQLFHRLAQDAVTQAVAAPVKSPFLWSPAQDERTGVTVLVPGKVQPGYTLFTSGHEQGARLIDENGNVLHRWTMNYRSIPGIEELVGKGAPDEDVYWRKARLLDDGGLLVVIEAPARFVWGYGMIKLSWDSQLEWAYLEKAHHDMDLFEDGRIATLVYEVREEAYPEMPDLAAPLYEDFLAVLSPDGREIKRMSLQRAILESEFSQLSFFMEKTSVPEDTLHPNSVEIVTEEMARKFPFVEAGQVMIASNMTGAIFVVDPERETVVWARLGPWRRPHDPDFLENGNILIFDNQGHLGAGGRSRVLEFDPETLEIQWSYTGTSEAPLASQIRSAQQRLANGNTLITESDGGRLLEVTPDGEIVWEYLNHAEATTDGPYRAVVSWGERIPISSIRRHQIRFSGRLNGKDEPRSGS